MPAGAQGPPACERWSRRHRETTALTIPMATLSVEDLPASARLKGGRLRVPALAALPWTAGAGAARPGRPPQLVLVHDHRPAVAPGADWRTSGGALPDDLPHPNTLWLRASSDGGAAWSPPAALAPDPAAVPGLTGLSDPCLLADPATGHLHLLAAGAIDVGLFGARPPRCPTVQGGPPEPGTLRLLYAVSRDAGANWRWRDLSDACLPQGAGPWAQGAVVFPVSGHGLALSGGRLVQPVVAVVGDRAGGRVLRAACLLSDDGGARWRLGRSVPEARSTARAAASLAGGAPTRGTDEHAVVELPGGLVLMSARDGAYGSTRLSALSCDGACGWGPAEPQGDLPDPGCNGALGLLPDGRAVVSHSCDPRGRLRGRLSVREPDGTWHPLADLGGDGGFGYSDLAVLPAPGGGGCGGRIIVVSERGAAPGPGGQGPGQEGGVLEVQRVELPGPGGQGRS